MKSLAFRIAAFFTSASLVVMLVQQIPLPTALLRAAIVLITSFFALKIMEILVYIIRGPNPDTHEKLDMGSSPVPDETLDNQEAPEDEEMPEDDESREPMNEAPDF